MRSRTVPILVLAAAAALAHAQASLTDTGYSQNFDGLGDFGSIFGGQREVWQDGQTLDGWYTNGAPQPTIDTSGGSQPVSDWRKQYYIEDDPQRVSGRDRSLASVGHSALFSDSADRALSFTGTSSNDEFGSLYVGLRLRNDTGRTIDAVDVGYVGELWYHPRSEPSFGDQDRPTTVAFRVGGNDLDGTGFATAPGLGFVNGVKPFSGRYGNGNDPANQVLVNGRLSGLNLAPGQDLWLRFETPYLGDDPLYGPHDDGSLSAIDDLTVVAVAPVPEPAGLAGLALGLLALARRRRSR